VRTHDQLHHGLREGRIDVALVRITAPDDLPHQVLMKEPLCLVVPLAGERVVFYGRSVQPVAHHWLTQQLRAAGLSTVLQEATLPNILATVAAGLAVSVLVSAYQSIPAAARHQVHSSGRSDRRSDHGLEARSGIPCAARVPPRDQASHAHGHHAGQLLVGWRRLVRLAAPEEVARQPEHDEGADDGADQAAQSKMSVSPMPSPRVKMT
jgi:hypothetical protein